MLKHIFFAFIALILTQPLSHGATAPEEIDQKLQSAETFADLLGVETLIHQSLKSGESSDLAWRLAKTYYMLAKEAGRAPRKKYFSLCLEQANRAIELNKQFVAGYFFKGLCLGKLGEVDGIWSSLGVIEPLKQNMETAIKLDPAFEQGGPHRALGKMYHELPALLGGSLDKSLEHLKEAVRLSPKFAENHFFLAETYSSKKEYALAQESLNTVLDLTKEAPHGQDIHSIREGARELLKKINKYLDSGSNAKGTENP